MSRSEATARTVAADVIRESSGRYIQDRLAAHPGYLQLSARDKALSREIAYGVTRRRRTIGTLLSKVASVPPERQDEDARVALQVGAYQLLWLDRVPPHAAVAETVAMVQKKRTRGFVNAVLRRVADLKKGRVPELTSGLDPRRALPGRGDYVELKEPLLPPWTRGNPQALGLAFSYPDSFVKRLLEQVGKKRVPKILMAGNAVPPLVLRVLGGLDAAAAVKQELVAEGFAAESNDAAPQAILLPASTPPARVSALEQGRAIVQDLTAQEIVSLLRAEPGDRVLELCAAPGGKAIAIADAIGPGGSVLACDVAQARLSDVAALAERTGMAERVRCEVRDGTVSPPEGAPFDRVLVDAPCSNTGVLRRRVEARWRLDGLDLPRMAALQLALLRRGAEATRVGGTLVYSTCSIEEEENRAVAM
ncbi:MAG: RsmB/NOP family class I SAM-dependent RNA methyltransferase, partial [Planctomycetota bacterium]